MLGVAYVLFARDAVRLRHLESLIEGFDALRALVADFSPQQVAPYCGIEAAVIEGLADALIRTERSAIYGRIGTCTHSFGKLRLETRRVGTACGSTLRSRWSAYHSKTNK